MTNAVADQHSRARHQDEASSAFDLRAAIKNAVNRRTLRDDEKADGHEAVTTPSPRFALRVGVTGHRPDRLFDAAQKLEMSLEEHEKWLERKLAGVFAAIEDGACFAHREHKYGPEKARMGFYDDKEPLLLRLVSGLALGTDTIAVKLVDHEFRGEKSISAASDLIHIRTPKQNQKFDRPVEWQIDAILPFSAHDFAADAIEDFVFRDHQIAREPVEDQRFEKLFLDHWRDIYALPDTKLATPTNWRLGDERKEPDPALAPRIRLLQGRAVRDALTRHFGPADEPPSAPDGEKARLRLDYALAGDFMLRQIDLLVAVWDGEPARGVGGAPDLVADAIERGLPVVYIDCDDRDAPPRMVPAVERRETRGTIVGWHPVVMRPLPEPADACVEALREAIMKMTAPPASQPGEDDHGGGHKAKRDNEQRTIDFLQEEWPREAAPQIYNAFRRLPEDFGPNLIRFVQNCFSRPKPVSAEDVHYSDARWSDFINDDPDEGLQAVRLKRILHRRYVVADLLAVKYADLYRGAFIKSYLLAALAVFIALVGLIIPSFTGDMLVKGFLLGLEFVVIFLIQRLIALGEKGHWHEKFVHYRWLAESLRHLRFLTTFAEFAETNGRRFSGENTWWLWYWRATMRELGLPQGQLGPTYQRSLLAIVKNYEIDEQIRYHENTARRESAINHALHQAGNSLFALTATMLGLTLALLSGVYIWAFFDLFPSELTFHNIIEWPQHHAEWLHELKLGVGVLAAALPTLGAALASIRFTADFDGKATRSLAMKHDLERARHTIDEAIHQQDFNTTRAALRETASILAEDVAAFQSLYGRKPLILPG